MGEGMIGRLAAAATGAAFGVSMQTGQVGGFPMPNLTGAAAQDGARPGALGPRERRDALRSAATPVPMF